MSQSEQTLEQQKKTEEEEDSHLVVDLDSIEHTIIASEGSHQLQDEYLAKFQTLSIEDLFKQHFDLNGSNTTSMKAIFDNGLTDEQVKKQREKFGENDIYTKLVEKSSSKISFWKVFISEVREPMILMLFVVGILYFIWGSLWNAIVVFSCIILMVLVEVGNEYRSKRGVMELKSSYFMSKTCTVRRNGLLLNISVSDLVPGDVISFNGGQILPADVRLYNYENRQISVQVDESILTGESMICNKHGNNISSTADMSKCENILLTGTSIKKGKGFGIVVNVGCENTGLGNILKLLGKSMEKDKKTELQKTMKELAKYLTIISIVMASIIVIVGWIRGFDWKKMLLSGLSIMFATIPEELPIIIKSVLALGSLNLSKKSLLIKKLHVPESLANITHIITDKTGTITKNCLQLMQVNQVDKEGNVEAVYDTKKQANEKNNWIMEWLLSGYTEVGVDSADPFEKSVSEELERCSNQSWKEFLKNRTDKSYVIVDEMPFDHSKGFATLVLNSGESKFITHKGIPERMITNCSFYQVSNESEQVPITEEVRQHILSFLEAATSNGMRVICLCKDNEQSQMVFVSLLSFTDPLRSGVKEAMADCKNAGIKVTVVSGDHTNTVVAAARECGLLGSVKQELAEEQDHSEDEEIELEASLLSIRQSVCIEGKDVNNKMDVDSICAISRATPQNKYELVEMLKEQKGYKVLVSGDGMNDVPAISNATVGIAMRSGVDLAKEAAEVIIMDDNFATIVAGIREGRRLYANLRKSLQFYLSCKVTLVVLFVTNMIIGGSSAIPFIPLEPMQIILLELFSDIGAATTFVLEEEEETLMKNPPRTEKNFVDKSFIYHIIIGSVSLFATVFSAYMFGVFVLSPMYGLEGSSHQEYAQSMTMIAWLIGHVFLGYNFRTISTPLTIHGVFSNMMMNAWFVVVLIAVLLLQFVPILYSALRVQPLGLIGHLAIWLLIVIFIGWQEVVKWITRLISKKTNTSLTNISI